jgi:hypothetical protein
LIIGHVFSVKNRNPIKCCHEDIISKAIQFYTQRYLAGNHLLVPLLVLGLFKFIEGSSAFLITLSLKIKLFTNNYIINIGAMRREISSVNLFSMDICKNL